MVVTLVTAGGLGLLYLILSFRVVAVRRSARVEIGDGGNRILLSRIRAHGNFAEYVPLSLFLLFLAEQAHGASTLLVTLAAVLGVSRLLHPMGMAMRAPNVPRFVGALGTFSVLAVLAGMVLWAGVQLL
ncbi:MAG: MAPEG family protein [Thermaurantiacus sp.]